MRTRLAALFLLLLMLVLLGWMAADFPTALPYANVDFYTYYAGAVLFRDQADIYSSELTAALLLPLGLPYIPNSDYIYPPYTAALLSLLTFISPRLFAFLWGLVNLGALVLTLYWMADLLMPAAERMKTFWRFIVLALVFLPTNYSLFVGQVNMILLALMIGAFRFSVRGKAGLAGILLGVAILIKVSPAVLVWFFLTRGCWRTLVFSVFTIAVVVLGSLSWTWDYNQLYVTTVLPHLSSTQAHPVNQSLNGFFSRLLTANAFSIHWFENPALSRGLTFVSSALFGLITMWILYRSRPRVFSLTPASLRLDLNAYALLIAMSVMVSPLAWENLYVLMVVPLLLLIVQWRDQSRIGRALTVSSIVLMTVQRGWAVHGESPGAFPELRQLTLLMSLGLYGASCCIAALALKIRQEYLARQR